MEEAWPVFREVAAVLSGRAGVGKEFEIGSWILPCIGAGPVTLDGLDNARGAEAQAARRVGGLRELDLCALGVIVRDDRMIFVNLEK
jgi:hypothetical protein